MALPPSLLCVLIALVLPARTIFVFPLLRLHLTELRKRKEERKRREHMTGDGAEEKFTPSEANNDSAAWFLLVFYISKNQIKEIFVEMKQ